MIPTQGDAFQIAALTFITSFVMPLYFILAGMTYNSEKNRGNLKDYAISRGRQLLLPYFAIYIIMMLLFIPFTGSIDTYLTPGELIFWLLYGAGPPSQPTYLWFLPVLYFGLILFTAIEKVTHTQDPRVRWPLVVLLPLLAILITDVFSPVLVPWRVNSVLYATAFCIIGHEMKRYRGLSSWRTDSNIRDGVLFVDLLVLTIIASYFNGFVSHPDDWLGAIGLLYLVSGTSGTIAFFILSSYSKSSFISRKLQFLGVNSQTVYEIHPIFFYIVPILLGLLGYSLAEYNTSYSLFWHIRFVIAFGLSIPLTLAVLRNRVLSVIFTGKSTKSNRAKTNLPVS